MRRNSAFALLRGGNSSAATRRGSKASQASQASQQEGEDDSGVGKTDHDHDANPRVAMQKKTFRLWVNSYLDKRDLHVKDVVNDWQDGIKLINLMELLSQHKLPKYNKKPKMKVQMVENLTIALNFIHKYVKLVNVGSEDLYRGNQNIVLGLIWSLLLFWNITLDDGKQGLLKWVQDRVKGAPGVAEGAPANFTSAFKDGTVLIALANSFSPAEMDIHEHDPENPEEGMAKSFEIAEKLGVPRLLDAKDVAENPDEKSIVAYVAQYFQHLGQEENPKKKSKGKKAKRPSKTSQQASEDGKKEGKEETEPIASGVDTTIDTATDTGPVPPVAPSVPIISNETAASIDVDWTYEDKKPDAMTILVKTDDMEWEDAWHEEAEVDQHPYTFRGLAPETTHQVALLATRDGLNSERGADVEATTTPVGKPTSPPKIEHVGTTKVSLAWELTLGAASYVVQYRQSRDAGSGGREDEQQQEEQQQAEGGEEDIGSGGSDFQDFNTEPIKSSKAEVTGLKAGKPYEFVVVAVGPLGERTEPSDPVSTNTKNLPGPAAPKFDKVGTTSCVLSWEPVEHATAYSVEVSQQVDGETLSPCVIEVQGDQTSTKVDNLQADADTFATIKATTFEGVTPSSDKSKAHTAGSPKVVKVKPTRVMLSWPKMESDGENGGTQITVQVKSPQDDGYDDGDDGDDGDETSWDNCAAQDTFPGNSTEGIVDGLHPGTGPFKARVVCSNGTVTDPVEFSTPEMRGKVALVTEANSKGGVSIVRSLVEESSPWSWEAGYKCVYACCSTDPPPLALTELASQNSAVVIVQTGGESLEAAADKIKGSTDVDLIVNNGELDVGELGKLFAS